MKTITLFFALFISFSFLSQEALALETIPPYEVHQVYPYISVSKKQLLEANNLSELKNKNNHLDLEFKSEWVSEYFSVEITVCQDGELKSAISKSENFTKEQKTILASADPEKEIHVKLNYSPKNNLINNPPRTIEFSFSIDPENPAVFSEGKVALNNYLKENAIKKISASDFVNYDMTAIKFKVNAEGKVNHAEIFGAEYQTGKFDHINQQLLSAIRKMPKWIPATYADGTKTEQSFVLTVGNSENCLMPILNIGR